MSPFFTSVFLFSYRAYIVYFLYDLQHTAGLYANFFPQGVNVLLNEKNLEHTKTLRSTVKNVLSNTQ